MENRLKNIGGLKQDAEQAVFFLLGKIVATNIDGIIVKRRITELEIYKQSDSASHAYKSKTTRNAPLFEEGGTVYVYLCYGLHNLLNFVTGTSGEAQGLMLRGLDNTFGSGKVGKILNAHRELNYHNVLTSTNIWLEDDGYIVNPEDVLRFKRVGIDYALEVDRDRLWRFRLKGF
jgi:DNA-3-methyladenine glycosylase